MKPKETMAGLDPTAERLSAPTARQARARPDADARFGRVGKILLWAVTLLPVLLFVVFAASQRTETLRSGEASVGRTIQILEEHALRVFEAQELIIAQVDQYLGTMTWEEIRSSEEVHVFLRQVAAGSPHVDGLWLVPPDGRTANSADFFPFPDVYVADRSYFQALEERDELHFGEMIVGRTKGTLNFNISRRRAPRDDFNGIILVTASLDYFTEFWEQTTEGRFVAGIFREDGEILARHPMLERVPDRLGPGSPLLGRMAVADDGVYASVSSIDGRSRIYGYSRIGDTPLFVGYGLSYERVLAAWRREMLPMGLIALLASVLLGLAIATIMRQNRHLSAAAVSWRRTAGELEREVDRRVRAEDVATERQRLLDEVGALTAQRQGILENMSEGVIALDERGRVIYANREAWKLLGPLREEEQDFAELLETRQLLAADGAPLAPEAGPDRPPLRGEDLEETEYLVRTATGHHASCHFRGGSIFGPDGSVTGAVLTLWDVTERKRDAERRDLLMRELDHRVRNMLATITAMIRISDEPAQSKADFVAALSGRVGAMARTHGVLSEGRWEGATMGRLIDDEMGRAADARQLELEGDRGVVLPPKEAADLALALHELSTNAIKYGAWSVPDGRVSLGWSIEPSGDRPMLRVVWKETGGPPVSGPPARKGFGTSLLLGLFTDGDGVRLDHAPDGLRCVLCVPLPAGGQDTREGAPAPEPAAPAAEDAALAGLRILVVEDEAIVRLDLVEMLREAGAAIVGEAGSLSEALEKAEAADVEVAVLDRNLNGESSLPVARLLEQRGARIVFVSGYRAAGHGERGDDDHVHLQKPISPGDLVRAVRRAAPRAR